MFLADQIQILPQQLLAQTISWPISRISLHHNNDINGFKDQFSGSVSNEFRQSVS